MLAVIGYFLGWLFTTGTGTTVFVTLAEEVLFVFAVLFITFVLFDGILVFLLPVDEFIDNGYNFVLLLLLDLEVGYIVVALDPESGLLLFVFVVRG